MTSASRAEEADFVVQFRGLLGQRGGVRIVAEALGSLMVSSRRRWASRT
ncbi:hypothetical protein AB0M45_05340 [Nocardia sp. NPDC051787]